MSLGDKYYFKDTLKYFNWGQNDSIAGRLFALHTDELG